MAAEDRRSARNPCAAIKASPPQASATRLCTHEQVEQLAAEVDTGATVYVSCHTGLRWGEMAALHVRDADVLRRRVQVRQAVAELRGQLVSSDPKSYEQRSVPFPAFLANELAALIVGKARDDLIFTAADGGVSSF